MEKIILVEDDKAQASIYQKELEKKGIKVELAFDGLEGFQKIIKSDPLPSLAIIDLMMPHLGGIALINKLKENETTRKIPILVLTNFNQPNLVKQAFNLGILDYLVKYQLTPTEVAQRVEHFLKKD